MTAVAAVRPHSAAPADVATLDIVIPVYNEAHILEASVERLLGYLMHMPFTAQVTVADNASTDGTLEVAQRLAARHPSVVAEHLGLKGRGRALKHVWSRSQSPLVAYMDVDLSTDLNALLPLVAPLLTGHSDVAIGTRLGRGARVVRGPQREFISRSYNVMLRGTLRARFSDAQCGFKAIRRDVAQQLLPLVRDDAWFFDTELLVLAERAHLRIHEVPVDWVDDEDSRVDVFRTATDDLRGIARLSWSLMRRQVPIEAVRRKLGRTRRAGARGSLDAQTALFVCVGIASTLAYAVVYLLLRNVFAAQAANALALLITAIGNTAANRRWTFGVVGSDRRLRHQLQGLGVFVVGLGVTSGSLSLFDRFFGAGHPVAEIVVLTVANLLVTLGRFVAMRTWIFRPRELQPRAA